MCLNIEIPKPLKGICFSPESYPTHKITSVKIFWATLLRFDYSVTLCQHALSLYYYHSTCHISETSCSVPNFAYLCNFWCSFSMQSFRLKLNCGRKNLRVRTLKSVERFQSHLGRTKLCSFHVSRSNILPALYRHIWLVSKQAVTGCRKVKLKFYFPVPDSHNAT